MTRGSFLHQTSLQLTGMVIRLLPSAGNVALLKAVVALLKAVVILASLERIWDTLGGFLQEYLNSKMYFCLHSCVLTLVLE